MSELVTPPQRYTNSERELYSIKCHGIAENNRARNDHLLEESQRLIKQTQVSTANTQLDVSNKLNQRLGDLNYWNDELKCQHMAISQEIHLIEAVKARLEKALNRIADPISTTKKCLENRNDRIGIDLVEDQVQKELYKETDIIIGAKSLLYKTLKDVEEQLRLNKKQKFQLEENISQKLHAIEIDSHCQIPSNCLVAEPPTMQVECLQNHYTVEDWHADGITLIKATQKEGYASSQLRLMVANIITQARGDIQHQIDTVNKAFRFSIEEAKNAKGKLEAELFEVKNQIRQAYKAIEFVKNSIRDKEEPLKVSIARAEERGQRMGIELCKDAVYYRLIEEINQLRDSIGILGSNCHQLECSERALIQTERRVEDETAIKENTIFIDEIKCMDLRNDLKVDDY